MPRINLQFESRQELLAHVASLYFDHNKNQQAIADELGITRSAISRLLSEARERGLVEIIVHYPWRTNPELEKALLANFNLKAVRVLARGNKSYEQMVEGLGVLAAQYFSSVVTNNSIIGVSWGTNLYQTIQAIKKISLPDCEIVQLVGGTGTEKGSMIGPLLAPMLAERLACTCRFMNAPLITKSASLRKAFLEDPTIRETIERAGQADIALVGIGTITPDIYNPYRLGYVTSEELMEMKAAGIVGDVCCVHYTLDGKVPDTDISHRTVGIGVATLSKIKTVIGVAGDIRKAEAIYGALNGGFVNVLITDEQAASNILEINRKEFRENGRQPLKPAADRMGHTGL